MLIPNAQQAKAWLGELKGLPPMSSVADKVDVGTRFAYLDTVMLLRSGPVKTLRFLQILQGEPRVWLKTTDPEVPQSVIDALDWDAILGPATIGMTAPSLLCGSLIARRGKKSLASLRRNS